MKRLILSVMLILFVAFLGISAYHRYKFDYYHNQCMYNYNKSNEYMVSNIAAAKKYHATAYLYLDSMKLMRSDYFYPLIK